jgi:cytochrome c
MGNRARMLRCAAGGNDGAAQMPLPAAKPPDGATLFKQQCATCHTTTRPSRRGKARRCSRSSAGRPARCDGFHYSRGFARPTSSGTTPGSTPGCQSAGDHPGAIMAYRQPKAETRAAIIAYLKELN